MDGSGCGAEAGVEVDVDPAVVVVVDTATVVVVDTGASGPLSAGLHAARKSDARIRTRMDAGYPTRGEAREGPWPCPSGFALARKSSTLGNMTIDQTSSPTRILRDEHQLILKVARRLDAMLALESDGDSLDYDTVDRCITFFRLFADACHHGKEEDLLFPGLIAEGMPGDSGPIAVMLYEHGLGRAFVRDMASSIEAARDGDAVAGGELRDAAHGFIDLIIAHISKEDDMLFNMADGMISGPACQTLCARYDEVCSRRFEGRSKADLEQLAEQIL